MRRVWKNRSIERRGTVITVFYEYPSTTHVWTLLSMPNEAVAKILADNIYLPKLTIHGLKTMGFKRVMCEHPI